MQMFVSHKINSSIFSGVYHLLPPLGHLKNNNIILTKCDQISAKLITF